MVGRASRAEQFLTSEIGVVHIVQRCVRRTVWRELTIKPEKISPFAASGFGDE